MMRDAHDKHDFSKGPLLIDDDMNILTSHSDGTLRNSDGSHYGTTHDLPTVTSIHKRPPTRDDSNRTGFDIDLMCILISISFLNVSKVGVHIFSHIRASARPLSNVPASRS